MEKKLGIIIYIWLVSLSAINLFIVCNKQDNNVDIYKTEDKPYTTEDKPYTYEKYKSVNVLRNWGLDNNGEYSLKSSHVNIRNAWKITRGKKNIVVAVIDTGIDPNHEDLKDNLWHDPKTGEYGYDFLNNKPNPVDENGHGTHVAGIIASSNKTMHGASGVAPDVKIMAIKIFSKNNYYYNGVDNTIKAIKYAMDHGANIINYSACGEGQLYAESRIIEQAIKKGIIFVVAAGNDGKDIETYPSGYKSNQIISDGLITVAANNIRNQLIPISNFGRNVDVSAPGENIFSTLPGNRYGYLTGTSQSTPFVTGEVALILSQNPKLNPRQVKEIVLSTVDQDEGYKNILSGGKINVGLAVAITNIYYKINQHKRQISSVK
jgi:subtilisin family serine protease